jgi:hypothetical protein
LLRLLRRGGIYRSDACPILSPAAAGLWGALPSSNRRAF